MCAVAVNRPANRDLFGHPRGLAYLFATEMWERFSFYGMRALLVLYMVNYLFLPDRTDTVIGLAATRHLFSFVFGVQGGQPFASYIYGLYNGLVYFTPLIGGVIADRFIGQHRTVVLGAILMALGHFMMVYEPLFLFALIAIIVGSGCFKPNISAQLGGLYGMHDARRDRAYSIFYIGINIGAFLAPLVCGTLGERVGWRWGFGAAGIGMLIALIIYVAAQRSHALPQSEVRKTPVHKVQFNSGERRATIALLVLFFPNVLFWMAYDQQGNTIALWADGRTDRFVNLLIWQGDIPTTWFQAFNPLMIFGLAPMILSLWSWQARRSAEPSTMTKMALGCFFCAMSYMIMASAAWGAGAGRASWLWLFAYFLVITVAELYLSPIGLSLVSKAAPVRVLSTVMGMWLGTRFFGNFGGGWLGSFWNDMNKIEFFITVAGIAGFAGLVIWGLNRFMMQRNMLID